MLCDGDFTAARLAHFDCAEDHATALIITARGLGLSQQSPPIAQALATQPAWGAQVTVDGL